MQKRYPVIGHVRGLGLMIGIEIVKPNEAQDHMGCYPADGELSALLQKKCFEAGLIPNAAAVTVAYCVCCHLC